MRRLFILTVVAACSDSHHVPPPDAAIDQLSIRGSCATPLGSDGGITFPDTAASAQASNLAIDLINGDLLVNDREGIQYMFEGPDAADFVVTTHLLFLSGDFESCGFHEMDTVQFGPGDFCRVDLQFTPTTPGVKHAT